MEQLTGLKLHYIPPGAMIPKEASSDLVSDSGKEKIKKEKKEKHEKHEKHKKHKKSLK